MKSSKATLQTQLVESWMATRPYSHASSYDMDYLMLAHRVLDALQAHDYYFKYFGLGKSDLVDLATTVVAYFEDFINEAGYWKAFVTHNHARFGSHLPFHQLPDDYDPDYINPEDLAFLVWQWLMVRFEGRKMLSPVVDPLLAMAGDLYDILDEVIEDMTATDAHEQFLTVEDGDSFYKTRHIMEWLSQHNYLFGLLGYKQQVDAKIEESMQEMKGKFASANAHLLHYDLRIGQLFKARCMLGGLLACEWTARVLRASPALKEKLQGIQPRMSGTFIYMGQDDRHYFFHHHPTGRKTNIAIESIEVQAEPGDVWYFNLIRMGDEFWSQGMSTSGLSLLDEPIEEFGKGIPPLLMTPEEHGKWLDAVQLHERKFVEVVGGHLGIFPSSKEAVAAQAAVYQAIAEEITGKPAEKMPKLELGGLGKNQPVAMYFVPGMGITFCINTPMVIDYLQHPETSKLHRNEVTNTLFRYIHPFMVDHILHHYPIARLGWEGMDIDLVKEAKFLSTYFFPEEAGPPKPSITLIDDMD